MTKKEKLRRLRISRAIKKINKQKKLAEELSVLFEQELAKDQWEITKERTKVKTFPSKRNKSKFFYSTKKKYSLKKPIKVKNSVDINKIKKATRSIKNKIIKDVNKIVGNKKRKINLGYDISMKFTNKRGGEPIIVKGPKFKKGYRGKTVKAGIDFIQKRMYKSFREYLTQSGFAGMTFRGYEAEIEEI